jgi:hypothetical protein
MIYLLRLKKLTQAKNKIYNFLLLINVAHVKVMVQNLVSRLKDVHIVGEMVKLDLIKVFLLFNKPVLSAQEVVKRSQILALIVEEME